MHNVVRNPESDCVSFMVTERDTNSVCTSHVVFYLFFICNILSMREAENSRYSIYEYSRYTLLWFLIDPTYHPFPDAGSRFSVLS